MDQDNNSVDILSSYANLGKPVYGKQRTFAEIVRVLVILPLPSAEGRPCLLDGQRPNDCRLPLIFMNQHSFFLDFFRKTNLSLSWIFFSRQSGETEGGPLTG